MLLFQSCHVCKGKNPPDVEAQQIGTKAVITTVCTNPGCCAESTWHSQPNMPGTKLPAGNFLLCMSILFDGGSITKIRQIFNHMGLACVSKLTFTLCCDVLKPKKNHYSWFATMWQSCHVRWQNNIIFFTEFAWKKSLVLREEIQFCSCNPARPPWRQLQTSNNISFVSICNRAPVH